VPRNTRELYLDAELFRFGDDEVFTGRDAVEGVSIMGSLGSGKTSGSGCMVARALLRAGWGGLVLVSKADELAMWAHTYFARTGRSPCDDIVVLQADVPHPNSIWPADVLGPPRRSRFNLLKYEFDQGGGLIANVVNVLFSGLASRERQGRDPFWDQALYEMVLHAIELAVRGTQALTGDVDIRLADVLEIILSAPTSFEQLNTSHFKSGRCFALIHQAVSSPGPRDAELDCRHLYGQSNRTSPKSTSGTALC
jgi:hypothetical protein